LRRAILASGGLVRGDWSPDRIPGDLYRKNGKAPDLMAVEVIDQLGWKPWEDSVSMLLELRREFATWQRLQREATSLGAAHLGCQYK
jgi:hypothetical protein